MQTIHNRPHVAALTALLAVFTFRVVAQFAQSFAEVPWLPPFAAWSAGGLPYPLLLVLQVIFLAVAIEVIRRLARGQLRPQRKWAHWLLALGTVYFVAMVFRFVAGQTFWADSPWFAASLPAIFHMVLAAMVISLGHYHWSRT